MRPMARSSGFPRISWLMSLLFSHSSVRRRSKERMDLGSGWHSCARSSKPTTVASKSEAMAWARAVNLPFDCPC